MSESKEPVQRKLFYYEEKSVLSGVIPGDSSFKFNSLEKKLESIEGLKIVEYRPNDTFSGAIIKCEYLKQIYEIEIFRNDFSGETFPDIYITQSYYFTDDEIKAFKETKNVIVTLMKYQDDPRKEFQLQLKIIYALVPSLVGVIDESATKVLPPKLVKMLTESDYVMDPADLYMVHAVYDETGTVWLHTHGLNRCGVTELEILGANKNNSEQYYNLLNAFANYIIENKPKGFDPLKHSACIAWLSDRTPLMLTCIPWQDALNIYGNIDLGGKKDRKDEHDGLTSVVFAYKEQSDKEGKVIKLTDYCKDKLNNNAILFYSNEETMRMSKVAKERIQAVYNGFKNKDNEIILKIGLPIDNKENDYEHIWFELMDIKGDIFKCKLNQEPYELKDIKVGDIKEFTVDDITDWIIYTKERTISPNNAYILID